MKRMCVILTALLVTAVLTAPVGAAYDPEADYMQQMIQAVMDGDEEAGTAAAQARNEKITGEGLDYALIAFDDLLLLSRVIYREAGSCWLS